MRAKCVRVGKRAAGTHDDKNHELLALQREIRLVLANQGRVPHWRRGGKLLGHSELLSFVLLLLLSVELAAPGGVSGQHHSENEEPDC